ncbi:MAG: hypothetical protein IPJ88_04980 [Myxococcales bacterium]|nr:MAG: hypothetical protein IPJ88_04980 [Myxococcales bacterium]
MKSAKIFIYLVGLGMLFALAGACGPDPQEADRSGSTQEGTDDAGGAGSGNGSAGNGGGSTTENCTQIPVIFRDF